MRSTLSVPLFVVALSGVAAWAFDRLPAADAAPSVSPFAGQYVGSAPTAFFGYETQWWTYPITVSDRGRVTGSWDFGDPASLEGRMRGQISGTLTGDGSLTLSVTERRTVTWAYSPNTGGYVVTKPTTTSVESTWNVSATIDPSGDLACVTDGGVAFTWHRQ